MSRTRTRRYDVHGDTERYTFSLYHIHCQHGDGNFSKFEFFKHKYDDRWGRGAGQSGARLNSKAAGKRQSPRPCRADVWLSPAPSCTDEAAVICQAIA